jgi:hypothetical protein
VKALTPKEQQRHRDEQRCYDPGHRQPRTSATTPDIACLSASCCNPSKWTRRASNGDGGHAPLMMDYKAGRLLLLPPILNR